MMNDHNESNQDRSSAHPRVVGRGWRASLLAGCVCLGLVAGPVQAADFLMSLDGGFNASNRAAVEALGFTVEERGIISIANSTDLANFCVVWINPNAPFSSQQALQSDALGNGLLSQYVAGGGTLVVLAGSTASSGIQPVAPGNPGWSTGAGTLIRNEETVFGVAHPYLTGAFPCGAALSTSTNPAIADDFSQWLDTNRGVITFVPSGATTVVGISEGPTMIEYTFGAGNGTVIMSTLMFGAGVGGAVALPRDNLINYLASIGGCGGTPTITCPANLALDCPADTDPLNTGTATAVGGCGVLTISSSDVSVASCGTTETITRTWLADDGSGNTDQCDQIISVVDTTGPVLTVPADVAVGCLDDVSPTSTGTATATDGCDGARAVTFSDTVAPGSCPQESTITRTWTATDVCGNVSNGDQIISVVDAAGPVLTLPADMVIGCDDDPWPAYTGTATATDDCDGAPTVTFSDVVVAGACPQESVITRTWTATDACGNVSNSDQIITIVDGTGPVLTLPADMVIGCDDDPWPAYTGTATAVDNCDGAPTVTFSDVTAGGVCPEVSVITRTWTATDACGNVSNGNQIITVADANPPVLIVDTTPITAVDVDCSSDEVVGLPAATATDDCDGAPVVSDNAPATFPAGETTTVTFTATDDCGNTSAGQDVDVSVKYGATIKVFVHQLTFGWGWHPFITKEPIVGAEVFVFARPVHEFCSHHQSWWRGWHWWRHVVAGCDESPAVNSGITDANGIAEIDVPPGDYLVVTFFDFDNNGVNDHFIGRRARNLHCGQVLKRRLRLLVTPRGKRIAARIRRYIGSELLIVEPDTMVWDQQEQEYPFGFESEGDWGVQASVDVPEGFVADAETLDDQVLDTTKGLQFTVTEVGSDLVPTGTEFRINHNGRVTTVPSDVGILLTPDYALSRGFDVDALRARGLIVEPSELGRSAEQKGEVTPVTPGAIAPTPGD